MHAGSDCFALNKILACANIPPFSTGLFKQYEREIGPALEEVAKNSCKLAAMEEHFTIKNVAKLCTEP